MNKLGHKKNYVFNVFYNKDTKEEVKIKYVKEITVVYKNGITKDYDLFCDIRLINDMGVCGEVVDPFVYENINGISCRMYVEDILANDNDVFIKQNFYK